VRQRQQQIGGVGDDFGMADGLMAKLTKAAPPALLSQQALPSYLFPKHKTHARTHTHAAQ